MRIPISGNQIIREGSTPPQNFLTPRSDDDAMTTAPVVQVFVAYRTRANFRHGHVPNPNDEGH